MLEISSASINMVFDLAIVLLPMPTIWNLKMALRKKVLASGVLSLGLWYLERKNVAAVYSYGQKA